MANPFSSRFITKLSLTELGLKDGRVIYSLNKPLIYFSNKLGRIEVPENFQTDLASVPRVPILYMIWGGRAHHEAVLHDYVFRINSIPKASFSAANSLFKEAMKVRCKPWYVRSPMYAGVCVGGRSSYHKLKIDHVFKLNQVF